MSTERPAFNYGGQAVIEGVMMRGAHIAAIAVRDPDGNIVVHEEPLNQALYRGRISRIPFVRGLIGLWDALGLGTKALMWSANIAAGDEMEEDIFAGGVAAGVVAISLAVGIGLFFVTPAAASSGVERLFDVESRLALDSIEGGIKLAIFIGYIAMIGMMDDVKRLFGYHGAEHKTINAYEAGDELTPESIQYYPIEHPRCGTAFLLTVVVLSIFIHTLTGRPGNIFLLALSRILVIPLIAGIAYEILRFTAKNANNRFVRLLIAPNLALQHLTTREPDNDMLEVAIEAFNRVVATEAIREDVDETEPASESVPAPAVAFKNN
jgi:uncharacterized protein YqhQ